MISIKSKRKLLLSLLSYLACVLSSVFLSANYTLLFRNIVIFSVIFGVVLVFSQQSFVTGYSLKEFVLLLILTLILAYKNWYYVIKPMIHNDFASLYLVIWIVFFVSMLLFVHALHVIFTFVFSIPFCCKIQNFIFLTIVSFMEFYQIHDGTLYAYDHLSYDCSFFCIIVNVITIVTFNFLLLVIIRNWKLSLTVSSIFFSIWGILNYYVVLFHGNPLFFSELRNFATAVDVVGNYSIQISIDVVFIIAISIFNIYISTVYINKEKISNPVSLMALTLGIIIVIINTNWGYVPRARSVMKWSVPSGVRQTGFISCTIDDMCRLFSNNLIKPDRYDVTSLENLCDNTEHTITSNDNPDIILILNESFYDLSVYSDLSFDGDYMEDFYSIDNARFGYAIVPSIGGGTNNTEYELLTSQSLYLLNADAPFNYIDMSKSDNNVSRYLQQLGYSTAGMHTHKYNYHRNIAYPAIGFNDVVIEPETYDNLPKNGNRTLSDSGVYDILKNEYDNLGSNPKFVYLLTYQNHGGYETNDASLDTYHTTVDLGSLTDDIDEYISSVALSCKAIHDLTDYYKNSDRKVIICMLGDHAPSFISSLESKKDLSSTEVDLYKRAVPYMIWSNFDTENNNYSEFVSVVDIVPIILSSANMHLSPFYNLVLTLHNKMPIRTSTGVLIDTAGNCFDVENCPCKDTLDLYFNAEYNSINYGDDYLKNLFIP